MAAKGKSAARITDDSINKSRNERQKSVLLAEVVHQLQDTTSLLISESQQLVDEGKRHCDAADNIIIIRYFEINGAIHQAIAAFKKRSGKHERALRELKLQPGLIQIGKSLAGFLGILTGTPVSVGEQALEPPE